MRTRAAIILVTRNGARLPFQSLLRSLRCLGTQKLEYIVVDNGSNDGTVDMTAQILKPDTLLCLNKNYGIAKAFNLAVAHATADNFIFVTQDVVPEPSCIPIILDNLQNRSVGAVGCKLLYPNRELIQHAGAYLKFPSAVGVHFGCGERDEGQYDLSATVDYVTGALFGVRRQSWLDIQGFDERFYPAYYEDVDFCFRLTRLGLQNRYQPQAVAVHYENSATKSLPRARMLFFNVNRLRFVFKHYAPELLVGEFASQEIQAFDKLPNQMERTVLMRTYRGHYADESLFDSARISIIKETLDRIRSGVKIVPKTLSRNMDVPC